MKKRKYALYTWVNLSFSQSKNSQEVSGHIKSKTGKILLMKKSFSGQFKRLQSNIVSRFYGKDQSQ